MKEVVLGIPGVLSETFAERVGGLGVRPAVHLRVVIFDYL
jgi:hypothetical protein